MIAGPIKKHLEFVQTIKLYKSQGDVAGEDGLRKPYLLFMPQNERKCNQEKCHIKIARQRKKRKE